MYACPPNESLYVISASMISAEAVSAEAVSAEAVSAPVVPCHRSVPRRTYRRKSGICVTKSLTDIDAMTNFLIGGILQALAENGDVTSATPDQR